MKIKIAEYEYMIKKNYREGFNEEIVKERITDYFYEYDYIFGDWAYGKLRLKGFYSPNNKKVKAINNIKDLDNYIKDNCAYDCRYFLLEKIGVNKE